MVLMAGIDLPERAVKEQVASALNLVVHLSRMSDGTRKIVQISEITGMEGNTIVMQDIFKFEKKGIGPDGRVLGEFQPTGVRPWFMEKLKVSGFDVPPHMEYEFLRGSFTTCRCPAGETEPWVIRAEQAELEIGGYGTTRNTVVDVLGVPVLWLPWMRYPLLTDRASGVLFPELESSSQSGFDVGLPLFWAALPNLNVNFTPHWLTKRGFKPELELEYVFGEKSWGDFFASGILDDHEVDSDDPDTPFSDDRYGAAWLHDQHLPGGARLKLDGTLLSDNLYPFDFRDFRDLRSDRFVESVGSPIRIV